MAPNGSAVPPGVPGIRIAPAVVPRRDPVAATAAGLVGFSIGTETDGSIISPASVNGIVGLRPTYGRVSRYGLMVAGWTMDKPGPMCRYVDDCATVLRQVMGPDPLDPTAVDAPFEFPPQEGIRGKRIGVLRDEFDMPEDPELRQILNAPLEVLESLGLVLEETELRDLPYREVSRLVAIEETSYFEPLIDSPRVNELLRKDHVNRWAAARMVPAVDYIKMQRIRVEMMQYASELFDRYAALVTPAWMGTAWEADAPETSGVIYRTRRTDPRGPRQHSASEDQLVLEPGRCSFGFRPVRVYEWGVADGYPVCRSCVRRERNPSTGARL